MGTSLKELPPLEPFETCTFVQIKFFLLTLRCLNLFVDCCDNYGIFQNDELRKEILSLKKRILSQSKILENTATRLEVSETSLELL